MGDVPEPSVEPLVLPAPPMLALPVPSTLLEPVADPILPDVLEPERPELPAPLSFPAQPAIINARAQSPIQYCFIIPFLL